MGTRILAVEDDERIRSAVKLALEDEGWTVDEAESGEQAIDLFSRTQPDVVLIDVQRGHPPALAWFGTLTELPAVPGIVVMELIQDAHDKAEVQQALKLVAPFPIVWPTEADCSRALADFTTFHLSNNLWLIDSLIAGCAVGMSAKLLTFNEKHYRVVPGLTFAQPYAR